MNLTCPSCRKVCRPRAKFCNHCLQSFAGLTLCRVCNELTLDGQPCTVCSAATPVAALPTPASAPASHPAAAAAPEPAEAQPRRPFALLGLLLLVLLGGGAYAFLGQASKPVVAATPAVTAVVVAEPAAQPAPTSQAMIQLAAPLVVAEPVPEQAVAAKKPASAKRPPASAPAPVASAARPVVVAAAAPTPVAAAEEKPAPRPKTVDEVFAERLSAECSGGLTGLVCREKIRFAVCADRWSESPPAGQSICKGASTRRQ